MHRLTVVSGTSCAIWARWTGRTLRIEIQGWVAAALTVYDADELGRRFADAVHAAVPEARVVTFTPRAAPLPA